MPSRKRSATLGSPCLPRKELKAAMPPDNFPNFNDGDVAISVADLELKLHIQTLCDTCDYFAQFHSTSTEFPRRFALKSSNPSLDHDADQTLAFAVVSPVDSDSNNDVKAESDDDVESASGDDVEAASGDDNSAAQTTSSSNDARMKRARAANEAIFRLLYRQPLSCASPADFRDAAILATRYGCVNAVNDALVAAILKANLGTTLFRNDPWALLNAAFHLRDESIFSEALLYVVGRGGGDELLPSAIADLVDKHVAVLDAKVKKCWQDAMRCCRADSIPRAFAAMLMRDYFDRHVACALGSSLRPEVYRVLAALHHMDNIKPLLQADIMSMVNKIDGALTAGEGFIMPQDPDLYFEGQDYHSIICSIREGFQQCINVKSVEGELRDMLEEIKEVIKPLFVGDRNVGYFTCMRFSGPFPWPDTPPSSR